MNILTGRFAEDNVAGEGATMFFHVGANMDQREIMFIGTMTATALKMQDITTGSFMSLSTPSKANAAIGILDEALKLINKQRADLGGYQNRFEMAKLGVDIAAENFQAAESILRDTDMATQLVDYIKDTILVQAGTAMLAQANTKPQTVLQLLG
jgi:flagellin